MDDDWFDDALSDEPRLDETDEEEWLPNLWGQYLTILPLHELTKDNEICLNSLTSKKSSSHDK